MTHALGCYYAPEHGFKEDRDYIAALQPSVIRILDPDVQHIADMHALAPNAIIAPRTWAIDDGSDEANPSKQVNRLMADPVGTGRDHAQQYRGQWDRWTSEAQQRGLRLPPVERILFNSANEPNQGGSADKIAAYSVAFLDRCTELGIRACAPCLGVGWPDNTGPGTPVDWSPYANAGLEQAIKRNGGMLSVHEYNYKTGPQDGWRWLAGRHLQCPFDVPIVLGEIGIDNYVYNERWQAEPEATRGNRGWQGNVSPDVYAEMIEYHLRNSDRRVVAGLIFITDFRNNAWESFNTRPAHQALLARKDRMVPQAAPPTKPIDTHLPSIGSGAIAYISAPNGLRLRAQPNTDSDTLEKVPFAAQIRITGVSDVKNWVKVRYGGQEGFMYSQYISEKEPKTPIDDGVDAIPQPEPTLPPPPTPAPTGNEWERSRAFVKRWEGEFQDHDWDEGNWTGCKEGVGEKKGTKFGVSACSYPDLDIRNITIEQADAIFFRDYWQRSGADKLPWPLCLLVFNVAVNFHPNTAKKWLEQSNGDALHFAALMLRGYRKSDSWPQAGNAWVDRSIEVMLEASKP